MTYFKLKFELKSFEELVVQFNILKKDFNEQSTYTFNNCDVHERICYDNILENKYDNDEKVFFYNKEEGKALHKSCVLVSESSVNCFFIFAYNLAMFYKSVNDDRNFLLCMKEARKVAMIKENHKGFEICSKEISEYKKKE